MSAANQLPRSNSPSASAPYGSREHMEWIARRLSRNLRFKRLVEEAAAAIRRRRAELS